MQTVLVSSVGEVSAHPDVCCLKIVVRNSKPTAKEAEESVKKRVDYILQVVRDQKIGKKHVRHGRSLERLREEYILSSELLVTINGDIERWQNIHNTIVEKLDHVTVFEPIFYHSDSCLQNLRQSAFTLALQNCKAKAEGIATTLRTLVGSVVSVEEKESREWKGCPRSRVPGKPPDSGLPNGEGTFSILDGIDSASWNVSTRVLVGFQLQDS